MKSKKPVVGIIMGSDSDLTTMDEAAKICKEFGVPYEMMVLSAHRTPNMVASYSKRAHLRGLKIIIAGAGAAAHLAGVIAAHSPLPIIGVPIKTKALEGLDSLLSIVQMPAGVPVATVAIGNGKNAGLLAVQILAVSDRKLLKRVIEFKKRLAAESLEKNKKLQKKR